MMTSPSVLLVLDTSALLASRTLEWQELNRVGTCGVPAAVLEEMQFLCDRAPEPAQEQTAREFTRFWPQSGWQVWSDVAEHPALTPAANQTLSKAARLMVSVAQTAYGTAQGHPEHLVVLVANQQPLLARMPALNAPNLCGITLTALVQWVRTQQKPPAVTQQLRSLNTVNPQASPPASDVARVVPRVSPRSAVTPVSPGPATGTQPVASRRSHRPSPISQIGSLVVAIAALAIAGLVAWRVLQPNSFRQFWRQTGLPALPGDPPPAPAKPAKNR